MTVRVELCFSRSGTVGGDGYGGRCAGTMDIDADYIVECDVTDLGGKEAPEVVALRWRHDTGGKTPWNIFGASSEIDEEACAEDLAQTALEDIGGIWQDQEAVPGEEAEVWKMAFDKWAEENAPEVTGVTP